MLVNTDLVLDHTEGGLDAMKKLAAIEDELNLKLMRSQTMAYQPQEGTKSRSLTRDCH